MASIIRGRRYPDLEQRFIDMTIRRTGLATNGHDVEPVRQAITERLRKGSEEYGAAEFWSYSLDELIREMEEECHDIVGWGSLTYVRMLEAGRKKAANQLSVVIAPALTIHRGLHALQAHRS